MYQNIFQLIATKKLSLQEGAAALKWPAELLIIAMKSPLVTAEKDSAAERNGDSAV